jgi:hypothetical protein
MKYKGFEIYPVYLTGSQWREDKHGQFHERKPTSKDIEYYTIYDPVENQEWISDFNVKQCKKHIDLFLEKVGEKKNPTY